MREFVERYGDLVWSLARRHCAEEAEDATQEVFIDVWKSAGRYDASIASEAAFVAMIARRRLIDRRRSASRRPRAETGAIDDLSGGGPTPETCAEAAAAAKVIEQIRPEQRRVLLLSACGGLTHDEIARETGMPLGTVKAHARRALLRIRAILTGVEDDEVQS